MDIDYLFERIGRILYHVTGILFIVLSLGMVIQIVMRFALSLSFPWMEELIRFCIVWFGFTGAAACSQRGKHLQFGLDFVGKYSKGFSRSIILTITLTFVGILICLSYVGILVCIQNMNVYSAALPIPLGAILIIIPVMTTLMILFHSRAAYKLWQEIRGTTCC